MAKYKIIIDKEECIGCGSCAAVCPKSFILDNKDGKAKAKKETVAELTCEKEAADACPVQAITLRKI